MVRVGIVLCEFLRDFLIFNFILKNFLIFIPFFKIIFPVKILANSFNTKLITKRRSKFIFNP